VQVKDGKDEFNSLPSRHHRVGVGPFFVAIFFGLLVSVLVTRSFILKEFDGNVAGAVRKEAASMQLASQVKDRHGSDLGVFSDQTRFMVSLDEIPLVVKQAFLAAEDSGFYQHFGISLTGMARALMENISREKFAQGGSTVTQQLVRQLLLRREKTVWRKIREIILSFELERTMSKKEILGLWLNSVYLGNNAWGVETAARHYFDKHISEVTTGEAALLAGLLQAPSRYAPHLRPMLARQRQQYVLRRMRELSWITPSAYSNARANFPAIMSQRMASLNSTPWVTEPVRVELWRRLEQKNIPGSGLVIDTTIDKFWQISLQELISKNLINLRSAGLEAAVAIIDTETGGIRAMVGGVDFSKNQYNRAMNLYRPVGASIYPLIFKWATDRGIMHVDGYSSIAEAAVKSRFAEAELLAPEMGYAYVREKLIGLGYVVKDAMAIDEIHGSPVALARSYLSLNKGNLNPDGLISKVHASGQVIFQSSENLGHGKKSIQSAQSWVLRQWMAIGSDQQGSPLSGEPVVKSIKGWNSWWVIPRSDVIIAAWVGADRREPRSPQDLKNGDQLMDVVLAAWIRQNLPTKAGFGAVPDGISYQVAPNGQGAKSVRIPFLANGHGVF
jgi:hypothetical protein